MGAGIWCCELNADDVNFEFSYAERHTIETFWYMSISTENVQSKIWSVG